MGRTRAEPNRDFYISIGRKIAELRNRAGITQEALAVKISLTRTSVINIEKGRQQLFLHTLVDIAKALQIQPADLIVETSAKAEIKDLDEVIRETVTQEKGRAWVMASVKNSRGEI